MQYVLYKHQAQAVDKFRRVNYNIDMSEVGVGKTLVQIDLMNIRRAKKILVVAPKVALQNWKNELNEFAPHYRNIIILDKGTAKNSELLTAQIGKDNYIIIINYEAIWRLGDQWRRFYFDMAVMDEAHKLANPRSKVSKFVLKRINARYKSILSATLITNELYSSFTPIQWLHYNILGGNFYQLRERFYYRPAPVKMPYLYTPNPNALTMFNEKLSDYLVNFEKRKCVDLPDLVYETINIDPDPKMIKHYNEMKEELITEIEGVTIKSVFKLVSMQKLMQISSGFVYFEPYEGCGRDHTYKDKSIIDVGGNKKALVFSQVKIKALKELLESISGKVVIFTVYEGSRKMINKLLGEANINYNTFTDVDKFKQDKTIKTMTMQIAQGIGVNLNFAQTAIYYERDFSLVHRIQSAGRIDRITSTEKMTIFDLITTPLESYILKKLNDKKDLLNSVTKTELREVLK